MHRQELTNRALQGNTRIWALVVLGALGPAPALHASNLVLTYIRPSPQHFIVPANVFNLQVKLWGGGGASVGGAAGYVTGLLDVSPGEDLTIIVAGGGTASPTLAAVPGGYGGGGYGTGLNGYGGSGGGATSILLGSTILLDAAGGGGGGAGLDGGPGGAGGGLNGLAGGGFAGGGGGTQTAGGTGNGFGVGQFSCYMCDGGFGFAGAGDLFQGGGGGGGGYYGGAGGAFGDNTLFAGGTTGAGGGGSSYIGGPGVSNASTLPGSTRPFGPLNTGTSLPANTSDPNYQSGVGAGGGYGVDGGNGLAVLSWTQVQVPEPSFGLALAASLILLVARRRSADRT